MSKIEKLLSRDKERLIQDAVAKLFNNNRYVYVMALDEDKSEAYYELWNAEENGYIVYSVTYSIDESGSVATITSEPVKVVAQTQYVEVKDVENIFTRMLNKFIGKSNKPATQIFKQFNDEEMIAIEPLYIEPDGVDGHGWTASKEVLKSMTESCNKAIQEGRLKAKYNHQTETTDFTFIKAFVNEVDCQIGEHFVPEGQPIIKIQFTNAEAWQKRKNGELCGVSIGAKGAWEEIND